MDYAQAREYLKTALTFGIKMGLHRMIRLMELLHNPEKQLRFIHIAGTNGKGSVSSYCAAILAAAGHRVGIYTSPYLVRFSERIRVIDGRQGLDKLLGDEAAGEISPDEFAAVMSKIRAAVEQMTAEGYEHPTEFELITAAGFLHFAACRCGIVVLETGLGGLLDSTNVIEQPLACIITALGYEHMERLGRTLGEIAANKAGIIKAGAPVYLYDPADLELPAAEAESARQVISARCRELAAPLRLVSQSDLTVLDYGWSGQTFSDRVSGLTLRTSLLSLFQPMNATLAVRVCQDLQLADEAAIDAGIRLARWPARLELLRQDPPVLLDGAHNPQGCQALAASLARLLPGQPIIFLSGILQDKDYGAMLRLILGNGGYRPAAFVCVTPDNPRALPAAELATQVKKICAELHMTAKSGYNILDAVHVADQPDCGAHLALQLADRLNLPLCAFGSLYLAGTIRKILTDQEDGS